MAKFVELVDADGVDHTVNLDHIIRVEGGRPDGCTVHATGFKIEMPVSANVVVDKIRAA